jgi:hypothetical protein
MTTYGYARVSATDQDLSIQKRTLKVAGCGMISRLLGGLQRDAPPPQFVDDVLKISSSHPQTGNVPSDLATK